MTTTSRDRLRVRRIALHDAIQAGDLGGAARAAARLRLSGVRLDAPEAETAKLARRELGQVLLAARNRRDHEEAIRVVPVIVPASPRRPFPRRLAAATVAAAALVGLLAIWLNLGGPLGGEVGDEADTALSAPPDRVYVSGQSRGRTLGEVNLIAVAEPVPSATAVARVTPSPRPPGNTGRPARTGQPGRPGPGGGGQGSGGTLPFGEGPAPGYVRFVVFIYDENTHQLLGSGCPILGQITCDSPLWRSVGSGVWYVDLAKSSVPWSIGATAPGYEQAEQQVYVADRDQDRIVFQIGRR